MQIKTDTTTPDTRCNENGSQFDEANYLYNPYLETETEKGKKRKGRPEKTRL